MWNYSALKILSFSFFSSVFTYFMWNPESFIREFLDLLPYYFSLHSNNSLSSSNILSFNSCPFLMLISNKSFVYLCFLIYSSKLRVTASPFLALLSSPYNSLIREAWRETLLAHCCYFYLKIRSFSRSISFFAYNSFPNSFIFASTFLLRYSSLRDLYLRVSSSFWHFSSSPRTYFYRDWYSSRHLCDSRSIDAEFSFIFSTNF